MTWTGTNSWVSHRVTRLEAVNEAGEVIGLACYGGGLFWHCLVRQPERKTFRGHTRKQAEDWLKQQGATTITEIQETANGDSEV